MYDFEEARPLLFDILAGVECGPVKGRETCGHWRFFVEIKPSRYFLLDLRRLSRVKVPAMVLSTVLAV